VIQGGRGGVEELKLKKERKWKCVRKKTRGDWNEGMNRSEK
jgi:hypothetical protein